MYNVHTQTCTRESVRHHGVLIAEDPPHTVLRDNYLPTPQLTDPVAPLQRHYCANC